LTNSFSPLHMVLLGEFWFVGMAVYLKGLSLRFSLLLFRFAFPHDWK
jgi:hypothetical protein